MATRLSLRFDPNQDYQRDAVSSVVDLFDGLPSFQTDFALGGDIVPNLPPFQALSEAWLLDNLRVVQANNGLPEAMMLDCDDGLVMEGAGDESWRYPNFTIEMETGTGKTYVYLRTIYELRQRYGFSKFIIVVPSIAIYEGVVKNFQITRDHFRAIYGNETVGFTRYDGSQISRLRSFATSTFAEVMVMTVDAFNKASNNLYKASEKLPGERKPYQFIQETRPILILDEPQNMESPRAKEALRTLHPLFALRYSATHRTSPNLVYKLTPFEAYRRDLVKKIQVLGVTERDNANSAQIALLNVTKGPITARLRTVVIEKGRARESDLTLKQGDNLYKKTMRDEHVGYVVANIDARSQAVEFENGMRLALNEASGAGRAEIFRVQIERTIEQHIEMQERLSSQGIKVLSLFFIDRVASYVAEDGLVRKLFDEAFERLKRRSMFLRGHSAAEVREAYFAKAKGKSDREEAIDTSGKNAKEREAEKAAFELIMRDKERLLSFEEPVCFIFAHSALKEGWDNPNVFQICTLRQTTSEIRRRQEIGRGMRLCVDQSGERVSGDETNLLTVIANESYSAFAKGLQEEYVEDGDAAPPPPTDANKKWAKRNDALLERQEFRDFWAKLQRHVEYQISVDTPTLIERCIERLNNASFPTPQVVVEKGRFVVQRYLLRMEDVQTDRARVSVEIADTDNQMTTMTRWLRVGENLGKQLNDERLRRFTVQEVIVAGDQSQVIFDDCTLYKMAPLEFQSEIGQRPQERTAQTPDATYPVFNLLDRVAKETGLTRPTINAIFKGLRREKKQMLLRNPEGFAAVFLTEVSGALADHVVERIEFGVNGPSETYDLDELFPTKKRFPQKEMIPGGATSLYDQVQKDSQVEQDFVAMLNADERVVFYFKFPPAFKLHFPKVIGNYNPDWGIARRSDDGKLVLHLVRETKGSTDLSKLQFPNERRKIECAQKIFRELGVSYRHVTGTTAEWWLDSDDAGIQMKAKF
jgi:type III restriction enzyme